MYQPFPFGGAAGVAVALRAVASYLSPNACTADVAGVVRAVAADRGRPRRRARSKSSAHARGDARDVGSVPAKLTATGALYQPFAFGGRPGVAVTCGAVASYLTRRRGARRCRRGRGTRPMTTALASSGPE